MIAWNLLMSKVKTLGWLLTMGVSMSACAMGGTSWKEEVLLHDGQKIIVKRSVERGGRHEPSQRPPIKEQNLDFTLPGTTESVTWVDHYSEDLGQANFNPMLLEMANGTAYVLAAPSGCLSYNKWGRPNPPYVVFQYQGKAWNRIPLQALPSEIRLPNLVISSPDDAAKSASHGLLSVETIKKENEGFRQPEYKTILRETIRSGGLTSCPIPTTAAAKPIAPMINGQLLEYNWWPLAQDWLNETIRGKR